MNLSYATAQIMAFRSIFKKEFYAMSYGHFKSWEFFNEDFTATYNMGNEL